MKTRSSAKTAEIARIGGHYAVQGQWRSQVYIFYQSKARMRLPISE